MAPRRGPARRAPTQDAVRIAAVQASLRSRAASVRGVCLRWGRVGTFVRTLRRPETCLLRCVAMKITRLLAMTLLLVLCGVFAAGCGSSSGSGGSDDPAALIPAGAPVYIEGVVRPDGKVRTDLKGALKKILRTDDPAAKITQLLNDTGKGEKVTFKDDVDPWLGDRVGVAVTALHNGPGRRLRGRHRLQGRRQGRQDAGQADGRHRQALLQGRRLPLRPQGRTPRRRSSITASWSAPRAA